MAEEQELRQIGGTMQTSLTDPSRDEDKRTIQELTHYVAKSINMLEYVALRGLPLSESRGWNDEVFYQVKEAIEKLGCALATLTEWWEPDKKGE